MNQWHIKALARTEQDDINARIDNKTKPPGALGQLEALALQMALIQGSERIEIKQPCVLVFAADHGIAAQGVSIAPSEVTSQMVANFVNGGAAINCFCRSNDVAIKVIDAGIKRPLNLNDLNLEGSNLINQSVGLGTQDFSTASAMTSAQAQHCLELGAAIAHDTIKQGSNVLAFGEMGIGNTSAAAAIMAALTGESVAMCVGRGTGITNEQLALKHQLIEQALDRFSERDPINVLTEVGGFEIGQICGAILTAAEQQITVLIDGFIVSAAALLAIKINPNVLDYLVFAHCSQEQGHQKMLQHMGATPLLDLGLRLGEGTGAVLAVPILRCACAFYNDMATFQSAGVTV